MNRIKNGLPEIPSTRGDDLHNLEYMDNANLVLFMAGNQFMVMGELIDEFQKKYPEVNKIFYETLPPGLELRQILSGAAQFKDIIIDVTPDIYTSVSEDIMKKLSSKRHLTDFFVYLHNRLVLMVPEGNPANISTVSDLGDDKIRISQPGTMEDISGHIIDMYEKAGGRALVNRIMEDKRAEGTTILTVVHHRETPLRLEKGSVDVGPVWSTEVVNAIKAGQRVESVEPGEELDQHDKVNYFISKLKRGNNPENADKFLEFIKSTAAQEIYRRYGFVPHF